GLFTKLLHIDLSQLQILGIALRPTNAGLIPGFIGLALMYAFVAFLVARMEAAIENEVDNAVVESRKSVTQSKSLLILVLCITPFSIVVYSMPFVFGAFSIMLLWSDSMSVLKAIWGLATQ
ncbi:MAG: hypothetical protein HYZ46_08535, partial [Nitrosomonadales bacterium]|nr:hypothetical protein [Nitrosomonadales bacterium]